MATEKQKKLAKLIIANSINDKPLNKTQMLEKVGYSTNVARVKQGEIINSEGVQQELAASGFTEENAMMVVESIMLSDESEDNARLKATDQVFKVKGSYAAEKRTTLNLNVEVDTDDKEGLQAIRKEFDDKLKAQLGNETV